MAFIIGSALRCLSAWDNLWLDEIWSVNFSRVMSSFWDVFKIQHDNNHILNTFYLYYFASGSSWSKYRLLSIITGALTVPLIGYLGFRRGFLNGTIASLLAVFSFPFIVNSSEARGYAPAMLFALTAYASIRYDNKKHRIFSVAIFWVSSIVGILSHLTFLYIFAGLFLSSVFRIKDMHDFNPLKALAVWYSVPTCFIALMYLFFVRGMYFGGGEAVDMGLTRLSLILSPAIGLMPRSTIGIILATLVFTLVLAWIFTAERRLSPDWIFYAFILVVVPIFSTVAPVDFFNGRYLVLIVPFLYLILASILTETATYHKMGIALTVVLMFLFIFISLKNISLQLTTGRGNYLEAVNFIMNDSSSPNVSIITDHEFRNRTVIDFYKQFTPMSKNIDYISVDDILSKNANAPEWLITHHRYEPEYIPPLYRRLIDEKYQLVRVFPCANMISGWSWFVYKKQ